MGTMLPDVAHLDGAVAAQLLLHRSIPLLSDGGLHMRVPYTERRSSERVAGRAHRRQTLGGRGCWQGEIVVVDEGFSRSEWWIDGEAQVRSGAFQIRGDTESSAEYRLATQT